MLEEFLSIPHKLETQVKWQFRVVAGLASATAALSALRVAFNLGYNYGVFRSVDGVHLTCCVNFLESFLIAITMALIVAVVGLWSRRKVGFITSLGALVLIPVIYLFWYLGTRSIMRRAEISSFEQMPDQSQHLLPLAYATWWDVYVLLLVIALIVWHLKAGYSILMVRQNDISFSRG